MEWCVFVRGLVTVLTVGLFTATSALAQITTGTVAGTIKDEQGLAVPGASVTLVNEARGTRMAPVFTGTTGDFVVPNVTPDTYTVEVSLEGFRPIRRTGVAVSGGDRVAVGNLTLSVGGASETITVVAETPLVQSQSGERSFRVTTTEVENLPIGSGRNFATLTGLAPGVALTGNNNNTPTRLGGGGQNNIMMDGVSTMDTGNNGQLLQMNPEAIAEVKVVTAGYQAEFGRSSGLQISAVTKGGTNRIRGSVYDVMRNSDWNSNSWVNRVSGVAKPEDKQADWGYTVGGPIGRPGGANNLFFFYAHEYRPRSAGGGRTVFTVPTALERTGDFSRSVDQNGNPIPALRDPLTGLPFPGNVISANRLYQTGLNILKTYPAPNTQGVGYNLEVFAPLRKTLSQQPAIRVDYNVTSALRFTAKYTGQRGFKGVTPGSLPGYNDTYNAYPWVHAFATTVNLNINASTFLEGTYGYSNRRLGGILFTDVANMQQAGLGGLPYLFPNANILPDGSYNKKVMEDVSPAFYQDGRALLAPRFTWGNRVGNAPPQLSYPAFLNTNPTQDLVVSVTKIAGRHTMKAGFYSNHSLKQQNLNQRNALPFQGDLSFANDTNNPLDSGFGFANAALGVFTSYTQQSSFVEGAFTYNQIEWYAQDNWRLNDRVTLDYGLRFRHQQPQYDANGQASNFFLDRYNRAQAPAQYVPGCPNNVYPCANTRQAMNPLTGQLMGAGTAALIGQIIPGTGSATNGIVRAGDGISKYNYEWPVLAVEPRFGAAWNVFGNEKLIVRGGGGLFYDRPDGDSIYYQSQNPPTSSNQTVRNGLLQNLGSGGGAASAGVPTIINYRYENDSLPGSWQWNTGVQIALPWNSVVDFAYVGQHQYSAHATFQSNTAVNINAIDLGAAFLPQNQDPTRAPSTVPGANAVVSELMRPIRGYNNIDQQWQSFDRTYHSLQMSATRRFRNGLSFGGNYTLSLSDRGTAGANNGQVPIRFDHAADGSYTVRADQAVYEELMSMQDLRRHVMKANFVWDMPDLKGDGAAKILGAIVNDWQLSGVFTGSSGPRYDIGFQYQNNGANVNLTGSPDYPARIVINGDTGSGCSKDRFRQFNTQAFSGPLPGSVGLESGRNYMVGCFQKITDLAIARNFRFGGSRTGQVRLEAYNVFDTVVYTARNTTLQLVSPTNQTIRNSQFLANGQVDPARLTTQSAGFGAATNALPLRTVQLQFRLGF